MLFRIQHFYHAHRSLFIPGLLVSALIHLGAFSLLYSLHGKQTAHLAGNQNTFTVTLTMHDGKPTEQVQLDAPVPEPVPKPVPQPLIKPVNKKIISSTAITALPLPVPETVTEPPPQPADNMASIAMTSDASFSADYLHNPKPEYPMLSRRLGEEGKVLLEVKVSETGSALEVQIKQSSGYRRLDDTAVAVVKTWRFVPARHGDIALVSTVEVPVLFKLDK